MARAVLAGAIGGAIAAVVAVYVLGGHPGRADVEMDRLRADVSRLADREAVRGEAVEARLAVLAARVERLSAAGEDPALRQAVTELGAALTELREGLRLELAAVDVHLSRLRETMDDPGGEPAAAQGALDERDESRWVVLARDPDPGVRFSALVLLGRRRTDRSVAASRSALADPEEMVAWQALRNVAAFGDDAAARDVTGLLTHPEAVVRSAAHAALLRLGAPSDTGFDPVAEPGTQPGPVAALTGWADSVR